MSRFYIFICMFFVCVSHCCFASDDTIMMQKVTVYNWTQHVVEICIRKMIHYKFPGKLHVSTTRTLKEILFPKKSCDICNLFYISGTSNPVITRFEYELQVFFGGKLKLQEQFYSQEDFYYWIKCDE